MTGGISTSSLPGVSVRSGVAGADHSLLFQDVVEEGHHVLHPHQVQASPLVLPPGACHDMVLGLLLILAGVTVHIFLVHVFEVHFYSVHQFCSDSVCQPTDYDHKVIIKIYTWHKWHK